MSSTIDNLVAMRDTETLYELMNEADEWMDQMDAAQGLVRLGDKRGYEFVVTSMMSDDEEILELAEEIMDLPEFRRMQADIEAEQRLQRAERVQMAKKRLQNGGKVFRYKMVYLPVNALMEDDPLSEGFTVPALEAQGLTGWEVINVIPSRGGRLVGSTEGIFTGVYFLLKKEVLAAEAGDLDKE